MDYGKLVLDINNEIKEIENEYSGMFSAFGTTLDKKRVEKATKLGIIDRYVKLKRVRNLCFAKLGYRGSNTFPRTRRDLSK